MSSSIKFVDRILSKEHLRMRVEYPYLSMAKEYYDKDMVIQQFDRWFYKERLEEKDVSFKYQVPSSWFQMFKEKYAPDWFIEKYPIKYDTMTATSKVSFDVAYPDFEPANAMEYVVLREMEKYDVNDDDY